jgi:hypothetical protein
VNVDEYLQLYRDTNLAAWEEAAALEALGSTLVASQRQDGSVPADAALDFVNRVEAWKAMGIRERMFGIGRTTAQQAQAAVQAALAGQTPRAQLEAFHSLVGFGHAPHRDYRTRPAKVASAAMRFLLPVDWGVVDWRSGAIASSLADSSSLDEAARAARRQGSRHWKDAFSHVDAEWAVTLNAQYRRIGARFDIRRNAEVDQLLFAISLELWPLGRAHD